jgi:hypothetical protein
MPHEIVKCRSCRAPIIWATMKSGKKNPIDAEPAETGNVKLTEGTDAEGHPVVTAEVVKKEDLAAFRDAGELLHLSHFASCPKSAFHRKKP